MAGQTEKRSSDHGISQAQADSASLDQGVGGRQGQVPPAGRGGGYQSTCTVSNFADFDERLEELRAMGLPARWIRIAETIGIDDFLAMWRILDSDQSIRSEKGDLETTLRPYSSYLRFQRNRYIEALVQQGLGVREIQAAVREQLCEVISLRHISRIKSGS